MLLLSFGFGYIFSFFFCGLHFFCVPYSISVLLLLATKGTQKKKKKKELLVGEIFVRKFLLFSLRFLYIFFGFLGTSLRASQKQLARLLLIVPFEYFTAGIAATLWLDGLISCDSIGLFSGYMYVHMYYVCMHVSVLCLFALS